MSSVKKVLRSVCFAVCFLLLAFALLCIVLFIVYNPTAEQFVLGTWRTTIDLTEDVNKGFASDKETAGFFKLKDYTFDFLFTFREDGTFSVDIDEENLDKTIESMKSQIEKSIRNYLEYQLQSNNLDMTVDEYLSQQGVTIEAKVNETCNELVNIEQLKSSMHLTGYYRVENGILYCSWDSEFSEEVSSQFTIDISESKLEFIECDCAAWDVWVGIFDFPMTLVKES